ncbi:hypothetical protein Harman_33290 [Haloarcula mannanilytica]|uniref:Uncharacterized protein n=2 Tax=Haloarcula mannanilytica TaxID=2509225 RepID=A0A4C2ELG9_9EURY|nr:hypothetical protein Harman_33290 [Haloarcula mannanilytica]
MKKLFQSVTKWIFVVTVPLFFTIAFFPESTIKLTFGSDYIEGAAALSVVTVGFFTHSIAGLNGATMTSLGNTKMIMYDNIIVAIINFGLNVLLIPQYPLLGAAVATAVAYSILNVLYSYQLYTRTGLHPFTVQFGEMAIMATVFIISGKAIGSYFSPMSNLGFLSFILISSLVYFVIVLRFMTITDAEKELGDAVEQKGIDLRWGKIFFKLIRKYP